MRVAQVTKDPTISPRIEDFIDQNHDDVRRILLPSGGKPLYSPYPGRKKKKSPQKHSKFDSMDDGQPEDKSDLIECTYHFKIDVFNDDIKMKKECKGLKKGEQPRREHGEEEDYAFEEEEEVPF